MNKRVKQEIARQKSRRRHVLPVAAALVNIFLFVAVLGGAGYGVYSLWSLAMADPRFRLDGETLALAGAVRECPESVAALEAVGKRFNGRSLLDPTLIADMEQAYEKSVWVKKITRLRRRFPNRVDLEFLLRLPAAQVWHENRYWMVDSDAALLPVDATREPFQSLPVIVGVTADVIRSRPEIGRKWRDDGVTGALGIMRSFWGSPLAEAVPIKQVVVTTGAFGADKKASDARRRYELVTESGAVVRWGVHSDQRVPGELSGAEKLYLLQDLLSRNEALRPGVCFDVRTNLPGYSLLPES